MAALLTPGPASPQGLPHLSACTAHLGAQTFLWKLWRPGDLVSLYQGGRGGGYRRRGCGSSAVGGGFFSPWKSFKSGGRVRGRALLVNQPRPENHWLVHWLFPPSIFISVWLFLRFIIWLFYSGLPFVRTAPFRYHCSFIYLFFFWGGGNFEGFSVIFWRFLRGGCRGRLIFSKAGLLILLRFF